MIEKVALSSKFALIQELWAPKIVGTVGNCEVKLVKFQGEFVWHSHPEQDEMFLVIEGDFVMRLRDRDLALRAGELIVIPAGVEHCPYAENEVSVMLVEPAGTVNTGDAGGPRTRQAESI